MFNFERIKLDSQHLKKKLTEMKIHRTILDEINIMTLRDPYYKV